MRKGIYLIFLVATIMFYGNQSFAKSENNLETCKGCLLQITNTSFPDATVGASYSAIVTTAFADNPMVGHTIIDGELPAGLSLDVSSGEISGVPTTVEIATFTIQVVDSRHMASKQFTITVNPPACDMSITTPSIPAGTKGQIYSQSITATGFSSTAIFQGLDMPQWLTITPQGLLSGTPADTGTFVFTIGANDEENPTCYETKEYTLVIKQACNLSATLIDFTPVCKNTAEAELSGGMPLGGTFSGTNVQNGYFDPAGGTQTITYTYTDNNQCTATVSKVFTVYENPLVTLDNIASVCNNAAPILLTGGFPAGGTYSGTGVNNGYFNPSSGTQVITYTYIDNHQCVSEAATTVLVKTAPSVTLGSFDVVCSNIGELTLTGGLPLGGTYTGTNVKSGAFNPKDGAQLINYTFTDVNTCANSASRTFPVNMAPAVSMLPLNACQNDGLITLNIGSPAGGIYTGTGVSGNKFDASMGNQTLQYSYTDNNACTANATRMIQVNQAPTVTLGDFTPVCSNEGIISLGGGFPGGGVYSGTGVTSGTFDASVGTQSITYTYIDNNTSCSAKSTKTMTVKTMEPVSLAAFEPVCSKDAIFELSGGMPLGGEYSGTGVSSNRFTPSVGTQTITYTYYNEGNGCMAQASKVITVNATPAIEINDFAPVCSNAAAFILTGGWPAGGTYTLDNQTITTFDPAWGSQNIRYTYTTGQGCSATATKTVTVYNPPVVTLADFTPVCNNSGMVVLRGGLPLGGTYTGTNVSDNLFDPSAGNGIITYTYTDNHGCSSKQNGIITVKQAPEASLSDFTTEICASADAVILSGGLPLGGVYTGNGVVDGTFNPSTGSQLITYTYTANNGCVASATKTYYVIPAPVVNLTPEAPMCSGSGMVTLTGGFPTGGEYSGAGVSNGKFDPSNGTQTITYTYTDGNNCTGTAAATQIVETCTGVNEVATDVTRCFPNPATNLLNINITKATKGNLDIRLVDMAGKILASDEQGNIQGAYQTTFDLSKLATGMYMVEIRNGNNFSTQKVVKQ